MRRTRITPRAAVVAVATAFACLLTAEPALAAQVTVSYHGTDAAADNSPGNGAAGWVWVHGSTEYKAVGGTIEYQHWDGTRGELSAGRGASASESLGKSVKGFRACIDSYVDGYDFRSCGSWSWFG